VEILVLDKKEKRGRACVRGSGTRWWWVLALQMLVFKAGQEDERCHRLHQYTCNGG